MAEGKTVKLVDETYCKTCIHRDEPDNKPPCHPCMEKATNINSKKPINYIPEQKRGNAEGRSLNDKGKKR